MEAEVVCTEIKETKEKPIWLLDTETWNLITDEYDNDVAIEVMVENGIICKEWADNNIYSSRFESDYQNSHCPFCGHNIYYKLGEHDYNRYKCSKCLNKYSWTSGTFIENTKLENYYWVRFAYLVGDKKITNSCHLAFDLGLTQKTTYNMLQTLSQAHKSIKKFINGSDVFSFDHRYDVLDVLLRLKNDSDISEIHAFRKSLADGLKSIKQNNTFFKSPDLDAGNINKSEVSYPNETKTLSEAKLKSEKNPDEKISPDMTIKKDDLSFINPMYISKGISGTRRFKQLAEKFGFPMNYNISALSIPPTDEGKIKLIAELKALCREINENHPVKNVDYENHYSWKQEVAWAKEI